MRGGRVTHDKLKLRIAEGKGNLGKAKNRDLTWAELRKQLSTPKRTSESLAEYLALSPDDQGKIKSRPGWWIAADLPKGTRRRHDVGQRSCIVFDVDDASVAWVQLLRSGKNPVCRYEFVAHSSRKHQPGRPRIRVVFPLAAPIPNEHYEAACRILAQVADPSMNAVDHVSFRKIQMMFNPSCSKDSEFLSWHNEGELLDVGQLLENFDGDWTNYADLPRRPQEKKARETAAKAEVPTEKRGIVGAFCRTYDVHEAIEKFIPDVYIERDDSGEKVRYTYAYGTGSNGVEVQDEGLFIYSHHGSDPCGDTLVNAFDMVRLHLFGKEDEGLGDEERRQPGSWPSFKAMAAMLDDDPDVMSDPGLAGVDADEEFDEDDVAEPKVDPILADLLGAPEADDEPAPRPTVATKDRSLAELLGFDLEEPAAESDEVQDLLDDLVGGPSEGKSKKKRGPVDELNEQYAVVNSGGTAVILHETEDGDVEFLRKHDFALLYANRTVPKGNATIPLADYWLAHPRRRQFLAGVGFWPMRKAPEGYFNLWKGFAVEPNPKGSCALFLAHLRDVVCSGNEEYYHYLVGWLAHMIQRPFEKPGVAVVLKGLKGAGKDTVGDYVGKLFPTNHVKIAQMEQLTGKFNSHFERALLLHAEEAIWAGDKNAHGPLQNAITAPFMRIERKNVDSTQKPNYLRLLLTTNEEWAVPAKGKDERRYFVLLVPDTRLEDHAYFAALWAEGEAGGYGALLHFLQTYDLSDFQVRKVPRTEGLADQKTAGLKGEQAFWYEILDNAELPVAVHEEDEHHETDWLVEQAVVSSDPLYDAYFEWMQKRPRGGHGQPVSKIEFYRRLQRMCPHRAKQVGGKSRRTRYHFLPPIPKAREAFAAFLGAAAGNVPWAELPVESAADLEDDIEALV